MIVDNTIQDDEQRLHALDTQHSFIVQAPAGSGKTELLTQRFLVLLGKVNSPEEILAITFTKKASAEMRARIIKTLRKAAHEPEPTAPHEKKTWLLARGALKKDQALQWNLLNNPNRLRIQTIDSFNASLVKHLPILSHFGAPPDITDDPFALYREAVQEFLSHLEENVAWSDAIAQLVLHKDNNLEKVQDLLTNMLAKRDQWSNYMMVDADHPGLRQALEDHLASVVTDTLTRLQACFPSHHATELLQLAQFAAYQLETDIDLSYFPENEIHDKATWLFLSRLLLKQDLDWRKALDKRAGFPGPTNGSNAEEKALFKEMKERMENLIKALSTHEKLHLALIELNQAPAEYYEENQWNTLNALYQVLRVVVAQLKVTFRHHGQIDYIENAQAALLALGTDSNPTDLALALDYQIKHILIDEFQDTSNSQYRLIEKLITGWEPGDGRTLFVVGDPMQSIYRFREAEVGLFIRARKQGIGHIPLIPLTLSVNFRSTPMVVDWVNQQFKTVLPRFDDIATGAVSYSASVANPKNALDDSIVALHAMSDESNAAQAEAIVAFIQQNKIKHPGESTAILVRARNHLQYIIPALKSAQLSYRAIDIDRLDSRTAIQDLMALTRALLHPADRVAWLAILRAPWCGLSLSDLLLLGGQKPHQTLLAALQDVATLTQLSDEGQQQLSRILPVLRTKIAERRRHNLRLWVESTWLLLGGPACLEQASDLEDVHTYFQLLEKLDHGGDIANLDNLTHDVSKLYAAPNNQADHSLQIMTIHNAKGLEFDTVILPYLDRQAPHDDKQLLLWMEKPRENANNALILAPVHATGEESDAIYDHIKKQNAIKMDYEMGRLLYVAATRAKSQLHLFFSHPGTEKKDISPLSKSKSLLDKLWPAIKHAADCQAVAPPLPTSTPEPMTRQIKRLTNDWCNPIHEILDTVSFHDKNPGFLLPQHQAKQIGIVVHQILEQISRLGLSWWQDKTRDQHIGYIHHHLLQAGIADKDRQPMLASIIDGINKTLLDARGRWILHPHTEAQSELALTLMANQEIQSLVIDRTFVDDQGVRWIIDYKTTHFSGETLADFLRAEQEEYAAQMEKYHTAMQKLDTRPIRLGLYFPLLSAWHEWAPSS